MKQKKILMLGGSEAQLISIEKAKALGYFTIVCDYLKDNPGQFIADKFYLVSTTDKDAILEVAKNENINGIVAYSSDPAAPTAAYVANKLGLPGLDYEMVCNFCEKQLFRKFLKEYGFNVPKSIQVDIPYNVSELDVTDLQFPVIVKPTDSSGSKGVTVLDDKRHLKEALQYAGKYSRNRTLIIEEYIQRDHPHVIEAEIFALNGHVVSWGLINSIRDNNSNPLLPAAYTYPLDLPEERIKLVKKEIQKLVSAMGTPSSAFNIEMIIDKNNRLFFLDAGPRNGGNMLPEFISMIAQKDMVSATIKNAMGDMDGMDISLDGKQGGFWGLGVLHQRIFGKFAEVKYSPLAEKCLIRHNIQKKEGEDVRPFERCNDLVGLSFFRFDNFDEMGTVMYNMDESMKVVLA